MKHTLMYLALAALTPGAAAAATSFDQNLYAKALAGDTESQVTIGQQLLDGTSPTDRADGVEWLGNAAKAGDTGAMIALARYAMSRDDNQGYATARGYLKQAASRGDTRAAEMLAGIRDLPKIQLSMAAPRINLDLAPVHLSPQDIDISDLPVVAVAAPDIPKAVPARRVEWQVTPDPAVAPSPAIAAQGIQARVPQDAPSKTPATEQAAAAQTVPYGATQAASADARTTNLEGLAAYARGNYRQAALLFTQAANMGSIAASANLGVMYLKGRGVNRNVAQAINYLRYAADHGNQVAARNLSMIYQGRS